MNLQERNNRRIFRVFFAQGSTKRSNNKSGNKSSSQTPPSNTILRPSQRVSNIFQTFAEGGIPTTTSSPSSSFVEQSNHTLESYPSTDLTFHPYLSQGKTQIYFCERRSKRGVLKYNGRKGPPLVSLTGVTDIINQHLILSNWCHRP